MLTELSLHADGMERSPNNSGLLWDRSIPIKSERMARADAPRERIGEMLLALGLVTRTQLDDALKAQGSSRLPIGKQLVALGALSETRLTQVLSNQLSIPWVSLERVDFPAELLARIPGELADRFSVLPIYLRSVRGRGETLYVAMDDPTDEAALAEVKSAAGLPVRPMIAPPSELRRVIEQRYFGAPTKTMPAFPESDTGMRSLPNGPKKPSLRAPNANKTKNPKLKPPPPPPSASASSVHVDGTVSFEQYETPSSPPSQPARTLTLLDGTQIALPSARGSPQSPDLRAVRHVVKAIRSARTARGSEEPLQWHDIVQSLLDALETRGIKLTQKEVGDAWLRHTAKRHSRPR